MGLTPMAGRSTSPRLGRNPKAAVGAAASVAAAVVAPAVVVGDRASVANPAGNPPQNRKYGGRRLGSAAEYRSLSYGYAFAHIISKTAKRNRPDGEAARQGCPTSAAQTKPCPVRGQ